MSAERRHLRRTQEEEPTGSMDRTRGSTLPILNRRTQSNPPASGIHRDEQGDEEQGNSGFEDVTNRSPVAGIPQILLSRHLRYLAQPLKYGQDIRNFDCVVNLAELQRLNLQILRRGLVYEVSRLLERRELSREHAHRVTNKMKHYCPLTQ